MLLLIQNSRATSMSYEIKCKNVAVRLHQNGYCCNEAKDYVKAAMLYN